MAHCIVQYGDDDYPLPYFANRKGQQPPHEAISLQDYRQRYACYRMDAALQELHAKFPMIAIWLVTCSVPYPFAVTTNLDTFNLIDVVQLSLCMQSDWKMHRQVAAASIRRS